MKIDLVRRTPTPPPIDSATIVVSHEELLALAAAVSRDNFGPVASWIQLNKTGSPVLTSSQWVALKECLLRAIE